MKHNQFNTPDQATDLECVTESLGNSWGSASAPCSPPRGGGDRNDSLLYLSCRNSDNKVDIGKEKKPKKPLKKGDKGWKDENWTPNNKDYKIVKSLRENIKHWSKIYGVEKLFFLTLTFEGKGKAPETPKEAQNRFNNFNRQFNRLNKVQWLYKGVEPQERGVLHYHIIGYHQNDLGADKLDWDAYKNTGKYRAKKQWGLMYKNQRALTASANDDLKEMWEKVRSISKGSKMGRSEFLPVRSANTIGNYVGKYLGKCFASQNNNEWAKGIRRFSYSNKAPQIHGREFSWVNNPRGYTWRQKVTAWTHGVGVREDDTEDMERKYGKKWAVTQREAINYYGTMWYPYMKENRYGHARPPFYPTGLVGNIFASLPQNEIPEDFHYLEHDLWEDYFVTKKSRSLRHHAEHQRKWDKAKKHAEFNERVYG